jgi:ribose transport system permease protein
VTLRSLYSTAFRDYTTILVLVLLCAILSAMTWDKQYPVGSPGGQQLAQLVKRQAKPGAGVLIVVRNTAEDAAFATALEDQLKADGFRVIETVRGQPVDARRAIQAAGSRGETIDVLACNDVTANWGIFENLAALGPVVQNAAILFPTSYYWPNFLKVKNLLNIANQIVVISIIAIGMTMVIIAGGIDLAVGSLVALSAVVAARLIRDQAGGVEASVPSLIACSFAAIAVCGAAGAISGAFVTLLRIPPFIVTLAMMSVAAGIAFIVPDGNTINEIPASVEWLTRSAALPGIPNAVVLMLVLYLAADVVMSRTTFGRYLYAVGGNRKAAWLCGVPVRRIELASYVISGALAGLAGILMLSQYRSGSPTYGGAYELQVIAAVVVGGTSLAGGQGRMFGTLLGALLIAVVQNGMNLMNLSPHPQRVVLGLVILAAAIIDRLKQVRIAD